MSTLAKFSDTEFAVTHTIRPDVGKEFLSWNIGGWDDVKKITKKVILFEGRKFTFSCWNSDGLYVCFSRPLTGEVSTAKFA